MGDRSLLVFFEEALRALVPSLSYYRVREANNFMLMSFGNVEGLMEASYAISSANIACGLINNFGTEVSSDRRFRPVSQLMLRLELADRCDDGRLVFLIGALLVSNTPLHSLSEAEIERIRNEAAVFDAMYWPEPEDGTGTGTPGA
jgi:hypothetical protein